MDGAFIAQMPLVQVTLPILIGFFILSTVQNKRFDDIGKRIDEIIKRLDRIEAKLENYGERIAVLEHR